MTQKNGQEPENFNWMEIAESDAVNKRRRGRGRLPFITAAIALIAVGGGALFAQTGNEDSLNIQPAAQVATDLATPIQVTASQVTASQITGMSPSGVPTIAPVAGGNRYEDDDEDEYEDEDDDQEDEDDEYEDDEDDD